MAMIVVMQARCSVAIEPPNTALEPTAAPLLRVTVAVVRTRAVGSTLPAGSCGSA